MVRALRAGLVVAMVGWAGTSAAELTAGDVASDEELMLAPGVSVVVALVNTSADGTNASPPAISLDVLETLSGSAPRGSTVAAWAPWRCDCDEDSVSDPAAAVAHWRTTKLAGPPAASSWILVIDRSNVPVRPRYPYSDAKRTAVLAALQRQREADAAQRTAAAAEATRAASAAAARKLAQDGWIAAAPAKVRASLDGADVVALGKVTWQRPSYEADTRVFKTTIGYEGRRTIKGALSATELKYGTAYLPPELEGHVEGMDVVVFGRRQDIKGEALRLQPAKGPLYVVPATPAILAALEAALH